MTDFNDYYLNHIHSCLGQQIFTIENDYLKCHLVYVPSLLWGNRLISMGYYTHGGLKRKNNVSDVPQNALGDIMGEIKKIGQELRADYIEFRGGLKPSPHKIITHCDIYADFIKDFCHIPDILLEIPRKKRADIRKTLQDMDLLFCSDVPLDIFYTIFSKSQHLHGTPTYHKKFFKNLAQDPKYVRIYGIKDQNTDQYVAACMVFFHQDQLIAYFGGAVPSYIKRHVYDRLYYELMCLSQEKNLIFNFGRSKYNTGSFDYKTYWGFTPSPYDYYLYPLSQRPISALRSNNKSFQKKIDIWKKLPYWVTKILGPLIIKQIG